MTLSSGQKLGHYEILELIGKGGMGEVYRAKDSKLGRDVAVKVLPGEFAEDAERLSRFKREAKVLASLNHANIASIYGLEQSDSIHYLVLELVEGETLAERIARGAIPVEEALEIAAKITDALEEAHEHGIVHRDLKPANVKITPRDEIKVLDFGLAKAFAEETQKADSSMSPTITRDATRAGVILGTAAYMSPEQAKGKHVDKRTDIFAFGAVLYEMLTGKKAFAGDDVSEVLAAVIKLEPDWNALPKNLSARLMELLHRCLEKDPKKRRRDIGDVRSDMTSVDVEPTGERRAEGASAWRLAAMSAIAAGVLVGGLTWSLRAPPAFPRNVIRFGIDVEDLMGPAAQQALAISPDGRRIVNSRATGGLYLREMDASGEERVIPGTEQIRATEPFFSTSTGDIRRFEWAPDGSVVFSSSRNGVNHIYRQTGGASNVTEQLTSGTNDQIVSSVSPDGHMVAFHEHTGGGGTDIWIVSVDEPHELEPLVQTQFTDRQAKFSPDGSWIAYVSDESGRGGTDIFLRRVDGSGDKVLVSPGDAPVWSPDGRELFFVTGGDLMAVDIRMAGATRVGEPRILFDGSLSDLTQGLAANYDITPNGEKFFVLSEGSSSGGAGIEVVVNWHEELRQLINSSND